MSPSNVVDVHTFLDARPIGRQQWLVIGLGLLILVLDGFDTMMMGFIAPALVQDWGLQRHVLGPLMMSGLVGLSLGSLFAGPLADRFGRRVVIIASVAFFGFWSLACALAQDLTMLTVARLLTGVGLGATMPNITTLLAECAPLRRRSTLVTSTWCGFAFGGAMGGVLSEYLIEDYGWQAVFVAGGLMPLVLALVLAMLLPESLRYMIQAKQPQARIVAAINALAPGAANLHTRVVSSEHSGLVAVRQGVGSLVRGPYRLGTLMIWVAMFAGFLNLYLLSNWLPITAQSAGMSLSQAAIIGAVLQLGGAVGDFSVGLKMDRWEQNNVVSLMFAGSAVVSVLIALWADGALALYVLVFCLGYCMMSANAGCFALAANFYPTAIRATGVSWVFGIGRTGAILGAGAGAVMMGWNWSITQIFLFLCVPALGAVIAIQCKRLVASRALGAVSG
ncbi:aromatic acid/H+ symport family MFS transporter [Pantoea sp. Ap-967]|uniref:MFS transporter n=1 Tax=Pantoea sp. Ap-967 TaxID=2608362 RepID=UPI0014222CB0|nr:aromatic acid/H+ symport family MFS transporter [Pantoea sp. Ap-967]NIE73084.1 aromatic acid/H+ symport family MFS transporter [Pantoea sp. Ap-967]